LKNKIKRRKPMKKILVLLVVFAMMFCLSATAFAEGDGSLQKVLDRGVLRVGAEGNWSPYVYNEPDGTLVGFEVEMAAAIAEKLGVGIEENPSDSWDGVLAGLEANRYDVVICGASPNPSRQEAYEVTQPYGEQLIALVVSEKNEDIKEWSDLKGKVSANSLTSSSGNIARNYGAELVEASLEEAMMLIRDGRADCQVNDAAAINAYIAANPNAGVKIALYYTPENAYEIQSAAIIKKGNVELRDAIDNAISELIEEGTAYELCVKYFGKDFADNVTLY
jgi:ABC-type amino acid transport/signal transduction systems, periplasmic component/domain